MPWFRRKRPGVGAVPDPSHLEPTWGSNVHPSDDLLEEYSFSRLDEHDTARLEEHLMLCEECRNSLEHVERFIQELKTGILANREGNPQPIAIQPVAARWRAVFAQSLGANLLWGAALAAVILIAILAWPSRDSLAPAPIALASFRGAQDVTMARGPAGRPLELTMDASGIGNGVRCRVEVVTVSGEKAWGGPSNPEDGKLLARVPKGLRSGNYWVRLYTPGDQLIREFGLRLD